MSTSLLDPEIRSRLAQLYTGDNVFISDEENSEAETKSPVEKYFQDKFKPPTSSNALVKQLRADSLAEDKKRLYRKNRGMAAPREDVENVDSTKATYGDTHERHDTKEEITPYPHKLEDDANAENLNPKDATPSSLISPFSNENFYKDLMYENVDTSQGQVVAERHVHLPRPLLWKSKLGHKEFDNNGKMSYMYSGYGNSGYDYDRSGYYDRDRHTRDYREYSMYPSKKEMIQTSPARIDHETRPRWGWCLTIMSVVVTSLCCPLLGFVGHSYASHAYTDHKTGDHYNVSYKRRCAWAWTITGLVLGILGWLAFIIIYSLILSGHWAKLVG